MLLKNLLLEKLSSFEIFNRPNTATNSLSTKHRTDRKSFKSFNTHAGAERFIRSTILINIIQSPETSKDDGVMV